MDREIVIRACVLGLGAAACGACSGSDAGTDARVTIDADTGADPDAAGPDAGAPDAAIPAGMIAIPGGDLVMGCHEAIDAACGPDELPAHTVSLSPYLIDAAEVTQADFQACLDAGDCTPPASTGVCAGVFAPATTPLLPVTCVAWDQAAAFCAAAGRRLPTEAEWELAARGTDRRIYPWGNTPPSCALVNYDGAGGCDGELHDVGAHPTGASPWGALDLAGNAREWVADRYAADYYAESPVMDPTGPATGLEHVARGGSAASTLAAAVRTSERSAGGATAFEGFRCARSAD